MSRANCPPTSILAVVGDDEILRYTPPGSEARQKERYLSLSLAWLQR